MRPQLALLTLLLAMAASPTLAADRYKTLRFDQLLGWQADDHKAALNTFIKSCVDIRAPEWKPLCMLAKTGPDAKTFFETFFTPVAVRADKNALFTGYFEPVLNGSLYRVGPYLYPIYTKPKNMKPADPKLTRKAIDNGALKYKGLEIAYVDDPVEAYYLHIQGSGRINLTNGNSIRVGYAGENGHVYRSAPGQLVKLGKISYGDASIEGIKAWVKKNPVEGIKALEYNPSYVFFRRMEISANDAGGDTGPRGALDRPITPLRTLAVDPKFTQMGAPVWIEKGGRGAMRRLMVAQDVGSAIKGPQRADIFYGTGDLAGKLAGQTNNGGRMVVLLPIAIANRLAPNG
ncbi:MAG: murein transglycosylase [Alphaproteobacteria bacterium]|nr:murein transglycosylase [Alphaproteobacteria bacterium]